MLTSHSSGIRGPVRGAPEEEKEEEAKEEEEEEEEQTIGQSATDATLENLAQKKPIVSEQSSSSIARARGGRGARGAVAAPAEAVVVGIIEPRVAPAPPPPSPLSSPPPSSPRPLPPPSPAATAAAAAAAATGPKRWTRSHSHGRAATHMIVKLLAAACRGESLPPDAARAFLPTDRRGKHLARRKAVAVQPAARREPRLGGDEPQARERVERPAHLAMTWRRKIDCLVSRHHERE